MDFTERAAALPTLGIGVSTEYGAGDAPDALDPAELARRHPQFARFLEIGVEIEKGLDRHAQAWRDGGRPCTYHFLDVNLDEPEDFDTPWMAAVARTVEELSPAWLCGDAGMWHFGRRDRGHMLLLPPVLSDEAASAMAPGIAALRERTGREVLPENPPGAVFVGDLHILDFFARVAQRADTGLLLDCAHLAIYQRMFGHDPLTGLDDLDLDRVIELHVAGGRETTADGFAWVDDDHSPEVLDDTWTIFEHVIARASNLRAVVFECERNDIEASLPGFRRIEASLTDTPLGRRMEEQERT